MKTQQSPLSIAMNSNRRGQPDLFTFVSLNSFNSSWREEEGGCKTNERSEQEFILSQEQVNEQQRQPMPTTKVNVISTFYDKGHMDVSIGEKGGGGGGSGEEWALALTLIANTTQYSWEYMSCLLIKAYMEKREFWNRTHGKRILCSVDVVLWAVSGTARFASFDTKYQKCRHTFVYKKKMWGKRNLWHTDHLPSFYRLSRDNKWTHTTV